MLCDNSANTIPSQYKTSPPIMRRALISPAGASQSITNSRYSCLFGIVVYCRQGGNSMLKTQNVSVDWDSKKKSWIVRIQIGEEIIRRPLGKRLPHEAEENALRDAA